MGILTPWELLAFTNRIKTVKKNISGTIFGIFVLDHFACTLFDLWNKNCNNVCYEKNVQLHCNGKQQMFNQNANWVLKNYSLWIYISITREEKATACPMPYINTYK